MSKNIELNYEKHYNNLIFGEKDPTKIHANEFVNLFVDLIIESRGANFQVNREGDMNK